MKIPEKAYIYTKSVLDLKSWFTEDDINSLMNSCQDQMELDAKIKQIIAMNADSYFNFESIYIDLKDDSILSE